MLKYLFPLLLVLITGNALAQPVNMVSCDIIGNVVKLEDVQRSPWSQDAAPSPFTMVERQVSVSVTERKPHDPATAPEGACPQTKEAFKIYKVCSPTPIKVGDLIHATEGVDPVTPATPKCLFDIYTGNPTP